MERKINERGFFPIEKLLHTKETVKKIQIQFIEWEKIFAGDATNKGLIPKTCKNLIHLNIKKGNPVEQRAENIFEFF